MDILVPDTVLERATPGRRDESGPTGATPRGRQRRGASMVGRAGLPAAFVELFPLLSTASAIGGDFHYRQSMRGALRDGIRR